MDGEFDTSANRHDHIDLNDYSSSVDLNFHAA